MNHFDILSKVTKALSPEGLDIKHGEHEFRVSYVPSTKQFNFKYEGPHAKHDCTTTVGNKPQN